MAKQQWTILFATFVISAASLSVLIVSFATTNWVVAEAEAEIASGNSEINYGLFTGYMTKYTILTAAKYDLTIVCLFGENKCIYTCQQDKEERKNDIERILAGQILKSCPFAQNSRSISGKALENNSNSTNLQSKQSSSTDYEAGLLNSGLWLTTIIFLSIATCFAFISAVFSLTNVTFHSVEPLLSVFGLYIWNGIAIGGTAMTLIMWGSFYGANISENIGIADTTDKNSPYSSDGLADLGYSYWILFTPIVLHSINFVLLAWRRNIINTEPPPPVITVRQNDKTIILY